MKNFEVEAFVLLEEKKLKRSFWVWLIWAVIFLPCIWVVLITDEVLCRFALHIMFLLCLLILPFLGCLWSCYYGVKKERLNYEKAKAEYEAEIQKAHDTCLLYSELKKKQEKIELVKRVNEKFKGRLEI